MKVPVRGTADAVQIIEYLAAYNLRAGLGPHALYACPLVYQPEGGGGDIAQSHASITDGNPHFIDCEEATAARYAEYLFASGGHNVAVFPDAELVSEEEIHVFLTHENGIVEDPSLAFLDNAADLMCAVGIVGDRFEIGGLDVSRAEGVPGLRFLLACALSQRDDLPPTQGEALGELLRNVVKRGRAERWNFRQLEAAAREIDPALGWILQGVIPRWPLSR